MEPNNNNDNPLKALRGSEKTIGITKNDIILVDSKEPGDTFRLMDVDISVTAGSKVKIVIIVLSEPDKEFVVCITIIHYVNQVYNLTKINFNNSKLLMMIILW